MTVKRGIVGPVADLLDQLIPDAEARDAAKVTLLKLARDGQLEPVETQLSAAIATAPSDAWIGRARPSFLYVMYILLLWAIPMGLIAAVRPGMARNIAAGMSAYLNGIPEPLYALFGTGYLGYTVAREWGKAKAG